MAKYHIPVAISGILVLYRSLRHVELPLFAKCVFPCPSDVTKPPAALFHWHITWLTCKHRAGHKEKINWLSVRLL